MIPILKPYISTRVILLHDFFYCPQSFSGGGLYSSGNWLLLWGVVWLVTVVMVCVLTVML